MLLLSISFITSTLFKKETRYHAATGLFPFEMFVVLKFVVGQMADIGHLNLMKRNDKMKWVMICPL